MIKFIMIAVVAFVVGAFGVQIKTFIAKTDVQIFLHVLFQFCGFSFYT